MLDNRKQVLEISREFANICDQNQIWYSLDKDSLLGAVRHGGFIPWIIKTNFFITLDGFNKLKRLFPKNIVDSSIHEDWRKMSFIWIRDSNNWKKTNAFVNIRVAVPTTVKKVKKYLSRNFEIKNLLKKRKVNIKNVINNLYEREKFQGYYLPDFSKKNMNKHNWIQNLTFEQEKINFSGFDFKIAKEWKSIINHWYGEFYMEYKIPKKLFNYPTPLEIKEVE